MRTLLHSLVENATVTGVGKALSLRIDAFVLRAAEMLPFERVDVVNLTTGERFQTWVEAAAEGSGEVQVHSGAGKGDTIAIFSFVQLHEGQTLEHRARMVSLDANNRVITAG
jgi:aspartate 1-decarboxylase